MTDQPSTIIAVDAHGGDHGLSVTVPASIAALEADAGLKISLVGLAPELEEEIERTGGVSPSWRERLEHHAADSVLPMDVHAVSALRNGQGSSLWETVQRVATGKAHGGVSGGNTGAMMALGVRMIGMVPGIERPVLMAYLPNGSSFTAVLDLGANLSVTERQLVQFAVMGALTAEKVDGIENPRVGLLNVGHEENKGHLVVRAAHALLKDMPLNYIGFVEGNDLYAGTVDVAVCDGFSGNLILKASEGLARMTMAQLREALGSSPLARLGGKLAAPALRRVLEGLDPSAHNGAPLLGLKGTFVKSHGHADIAAFRRAILEAAQAARKRLPQRIDSLIQQYHLEA